jgi:hypothetical protein
MHRLFGSVLAFIIAFRTNNAYQSYVEGKLSLLFLLVYVRWMVSMRVSPTFTKPNRQQHPKSNRPQGHRHDDGGHPRDHARGLHRPPERPPRPVHGLRLGAADDGAGAERGGAEAPGSGTWMCGWGWVWVVVSGWGGERPVQPIYQRS